MQAAKLEAFGEWARWSDGLISAVQSARSPAEVEALSQEWAQTVAEDLPIAASLYRTRLHAEMAGHLFVRDVEVPEVDGRTVSLAIPDARISFLRLPFREAIDAFLAREVVDADTFDRMSLEARLNAFTATQAASSTAVETIRRALQMALEEGVTLQQFQAELDATVLGTAAERSFYLETIYRTNVQQSYGTGRLKQMESPAVVEARPLVQYRTVGDSRVRPRHAALRGVVFDRSADDGWRRFAPPLGFSCRCQMVTLRPDQASGVTITNSADIDPAEAGPDPGWSGPGGL